MFIAFFKNSDLKCSVSWLYGFKNKVITLLCNVEVRMAVSIHVRVFHWNSPDVLGASNDVPVKSEAVKSTENITLLVIGSHS
jgi:hypothetical protein